MDIRSIISKNPEVLGGTPVFSGTRVPIETLFDHLEAGVPLDAFLDDFPTVTKEQAVALLPSSSPFLNYGFPNISRHIFPFKTQTRHYRDKSYLIATHLCQN